PPAIVRNSRRLMLAPRLRIGASYRLKLRSWKAPKCVRTDVRFSKRPVLVKHFQAIHHLGESTSLAGSRFSPESAPGPFHHGIRGRGGTIFGSALPSE